MTAIEAGCLLWLSEDAPDANVLSDFLLCLLLSRVDESTLWSEP
jgi:hypothetical protein